MNTIGRQRGMGLLQWIAIILLLSFLGKFAFCVIPLYTENRYVITGLRSIEDGGNRLSDMSDDEIRKRMANFYMINNVNSVGPTKSIKIDRVDDKVLVTVDYETRVNFLLNIDIVMSFKNHLDSTRVSLCCTPLPENDDTTH